MLSVDMAGVSIAGVGTAGVEEHVMLRCLLPEHRSAAALHAGHLCKCQPSGMNGLAFVVIAEVVRGVIPGKPFQCSPQTCRA
jgi:hypothetical protein